MPRLTHSAKQRAAKVSAKVSTKGASDSPPPLRSDARSERWRDHRVKVRQEFVEAAVRALDRCGPEVSMDDIAKEAGAAKPKLYRHFEDKLDLYTAVVAHIQHELTSRIATKANLLTDTTRQLIASSSREYAEFVTEHPNVFRFLVHGHYTRASGEPERTVAAAHDSARRSVSLLTIALRDSNISVENAELVSFSIFGAVVSATDWWIGPNAADSQPLPIDEFAKYLSAISRGVIDSAAALADITIDFDQPLYLAFSAAMSTTAE
ncbi:TetR/AcrR family transcriptional regulator [Antrihabitans sp. YC3-6]|uniref:TetR/AcrR family transcriptional regulator n=1 Tax=Antrihabitans stalagmiti TaxID=2799499 RepID=A0A934NQZ5_9NOCA|nr:TetR/AcrR family transcriptional regulator [Antrihabitans stalagmiti]MBJ8339724.1 TetR/AcrR family transcriptional regulator [Antrihabitans stalagmiti]